MGRRLLTALLLLTGAAAAAASVAAGQEDRLEDGGLGSIATPCRELVRAVCGADDECQDDPWCAAANLLGEADPTGKRCLSAQQDPTSYRPCDTDGSGLILGVPDDCAELLDHVCGVPDGQSGQRPCEGQATCFNALLLAQADDSQGDGGPMALDVAVGDATGDPGVEDGGSLVGEQQRCREALQEPGLYPRCAP